MNNKRISFLTIIIISWWVGLSLGDLWQEKEFIEAARDANIKTLHALLNKGVDVNFIGYDGTALMVAARFR